MIHLEETLEQIRAAGLWRKLQPQQHMGARDVADLHCFASNDYLGLATHPEVAESFRDGLSRYGHGSASSRLICGTSVAHTDLEEAIADLKGTERALSFSSGYAAAMGTIPALLGREDFIVLDKLCHACLIDAAKLSAATLRVFPHNHLGKLEQILQSIRAKHGATARILIVTESVFSMDGDTAPLGEIVELKDRYAAWLWVDEAHGFGVIGENGGGLSEMLKLQDRIEIQMGTLSKAAGLAGGFIAGSSPLIDLLINRARSLIYSTAPPPALAHAASTAISLIRSPEGVTLRQKLQSNLQRFLADSPLVHHTTPIIPVMLGDNPSALAAAEKLLLAGYRVPAIRYPTVPRNQARLRISLSAVHTPAAIDGLKSELRSISSLWQCGSHSQ